MHVHREMIFGANELCEDMLQMDILASAGVIRYGGSATSKATISGETGSVSAVTYDDFVALALSLDTNRCPMNTTVITGDRMEDTLTINAARFMYVSPALVPTLKRMVDNFGNQALIEARHYGGQTTIMKNELGSIDNFRIIVVQEMLYWAGEGAAVSTNAGYRTTANKYDVYPMLVVGDKSFTTIGFKTGGKGSKFDIQHHKPGSPAAMGITQDPYGKIGIESIQWWYGFMVLRSERIALMLTVAEM
jgi:N4-gp56 family major capsid protein